MVRAYRANALLDAHTEDPESGYRLLFDESRDAGEPMADRTAWTIVSQNGWWSVYGKKRGRTGKNPGPAAHDDLCTVTDEDGRSRHVFTAAEPNRLWLTDITEHTTGKGKLYPSAVKDVYSAPIMGYSIDSRMKSKLAMTALKNAVRMRGDVAGCILHSDRGSQFRNRKLRRAPTRHSMAGSMGRVASGGERGDGELLRAPAENVLNRRSWAAREELRIAIVTWIEGAYHRRRRQGALGRLTPIVFETIMRTNVALAA